MTAYRILPYLLAISLLLTGCWSRKEINDRIFTAVMLVDVGKKEGEVKLTLGFPLAGRLSTIQKSSGSEGKPFASVTKTADSLAAAYRKIQTDISRQINWGHTRVIIVGDKLAKRGIRPVLEFVSQQQTFQIKSNLFIVPGEAQLFENTVPSFERFPSEILREMAAQHSIIDTTVKDLMMGGTFLEDGLIGRINLNQGKLVSENGKMGQRIENMGAAMIKDGKLAGYFNVGEMRGAMWIKGRMENAVITIEAPTDGKLIDLMVVNSKTKIKVEPKKEHVLFRIQIHALDDILSSDSDMNLQEPEQIKQLSQQLNEKLTERIHRALYKSQKMGVDAFQLGEYLEWYLPAYWNRWKEDWHRHYQEDVEFVVEADVKVKRPGGVRLPYWKPTEQQEKEAEAP